MKEKVSIIVPCYGTEKYIERCLDSLINQTYSNIEIIAVNDASPFDMKEILEKYKEKDHRIKIVNHKKNKGLFQARLSGADVSTGTYICFVDSDDYISVDYIRNLVFDIKRKKADMVFSNTVLLEEKKLLSYPLLDFYLDEIKGENCLNYFFDQKGLNYRWHTLCNKLYTKDLWDKARPYYNKIEKHLIMTEDFAFSTVLFYFCKKIVFNEYANYFYCQNDDASTSLIKANYEKYNKNIDDVLTSFEFVKNFLKSQKVYSTYKNNFDIWYKIYLKIWHNNIKKSDLDDEQKEKLISKNKNIKDFKYKNYTNFYNPITSFNNSYEKLIEAVINSDTISFDIFDTLILRPFYEPKDLFKIINKKFKHLYKDSVVDFAQIRENAEKMCREQFTKKDGCEEITLDQIYKQIQKMYNVKDEHIKELKQYEKELELKYCFVRRSGQNLYNLAKFLNKRVIIVSDMYLPKTLIKEILRKNGYEVDEIYLSSEQKKAKATGNLYNIVLEKEAEDKKITHFGDNYQSDCVNAKEKGINSMQLPKGTEVMWPYIYKIFTKSSYNIDTDMFISLGGIRASLGLVANKFFDNPFVSFEATSAFNCNPALVGYFALGMHSFTITKWIYDDVIKKKYDSLTFMARDGYLINKEFNIFKDYFNSKIITNYLPISRKALLPYSFSNKNEIINMINYLRYENVSPNDIYKMFGPIMKKTPNNSKKRFKTETDLIRFINDTIIPNVDEKKMLAKRNILKKYFLNFYKGKSANFDIGYSGKPENTLTRLLKKPIDTYFVHFNNDEGFKYSNNEFSLNTFYDFKPSFTGLLREYIMSELSGSCIKYEIDKDVNPIMDDIDNNYYEQRILDIIQNSALKFTEDMLDAYGEYINDIYFPNYYMSIPFEYFMHSSDSYDRLLFKGLLFEDSINKDIEIEELWSELYVKNRTLNEMPVTFESILNNFYNIQVANRNKFIKLLYYTFFDRITLRKKLKKILKR